jgi:monoterpene epsilon-lactone hydrolase
LIRTHPPRRGVPGRWLIAASIAAGAATIAPAQAQPDPAPRQAPAKLLPVPNTVSPGMRALIAAPLPPGWNAIPQTPETWRRLAAQSAAEVMPHLPGLRAYLGVSVEETSIAGVRVYAVTPNDLPPENRDRLLIHVHGGGYVLYPGEAGAGEGMLMAGFGRFKVISVDYRMPPDAPFPAALDDVMAVWRAALGLTDARKMAVFGSSAGGGLTLAMVLRAKQEGLPLPAAIAPGTPWSDMAGDGDSYAANEYVDNVLVSNGGWLGAAARLYAGPLDLREPLLSPVHGDFRGFPPAILTTGTRDLFLSNTVRAHRKLRRAGVEAVLQVFEGQSHAQYLADPYVPEAKEAFEEIARFFEAHLQR